MWCWVLLVGLVLGCATTGGRIADDRPNIVIILIDDLGYHDLSIHGSNEVSTPNIDSIAREGVRLSHGYASAPICAPMRAGLLTGRDQAYEQVIEVQRVLGQCEHDRRHQKKAGDAMLLDELEHLDQVESRHGHHLGTLRKGVVHQDLHAVDMKEGENGEADIALVEAKVPTELL